MNDFAVPSQPIPAHLLDEDPGNDDDLVAASLAGAAALAVWPRGKAPSEVGFEIVRELIPEDLPFANAPRGSGGATSAETVKLRSAHHQIAQLVAAGRKQADISLITGYTQSYLSDMRNNPAFEALVAHYAGVGELRFVDEMARLKALGVQAAEVLQDRLAQSEDEFTVRELNEIIDMTIVRPATAAMKATGQVAAAAASPRAFEVVFKSASRREAPIIEGKAE